MNLELFVFVGVCMGLGMFGVMKGPDGPPGPAPQPLRGPYSNLILILLIGLVLLTPALVILDKLGYIWKRRQIASDSDKERRRE